MASNEEPRVLSVQSHVVHGYVGNKSATFPLQLLGFDVDAINTVQFSNHTGYKHIRGNILNDSETSALVEGLTLNGLMKYTHLLTGYARHPDLLNTIADIVKTLRADNENFVYVCDPVMGDEGKMYVPVEFVPIFRETLIPLSDIVTPNQFEIQQLTGIEVNTVEDACRAMEALQASGAKTVIISSSELGDDDHMLGLAMTVDGKRYKIKIPKVPAHFTGTGDLFACLMLAWTHRTNNDIKTSMEKTIATLQHILLDTYRYATEKHGNAKLTSDQVELRLIQNKKIIEDPEVTIFATEI